MSDKLNQKRSRRSFLQLSGAAALGMISLPAFGQGSTEAPSDDPFLNGVNNGPGRQGPNDGPPSGGGGLGGGPNGRGPGASRRNAIPGPYPTSVVAQQDFSIALGRPTDVSVTANVVSGVDREGYLEYGLSPNSYTQKSSITTLPAKKPVEFLLDGLKQDTEYSYRVLTRFPGDQQFTETAAHTFHTQRAPGSAFTFTIQGDSHPERPFQHDPTLYAQTLTAVAAENPDFHVTIGDDFTVERLPTVDPEVLKLVHLYQRYFLGLVTGSAPVFLGNGNHEQTSLANLDGTPDNVAVWSQNSRNSLFPQPAPDHFYTGNSIPVDYIGYVREYYAFNWGDVLFVTIDPYWHSKHYVDTTYGGAPRTNDIWNSTLGDDQYAWLTKTLESSKAKYKIVFTHHINGTQRGGVDIADQGEWGGYDEDGNYEFDQERPNWKLPIHSLFVKTGVNIVFQGHDHLFAKDEADGVVYQTLPCPADLNYADGFANAYRTKIKFPCSGYLRVKVASDKLDVEYVRQYLPADETATQKSGDVAYTYSVVGRGSKLS